VKAKRRNRVEFMEHGGDSTSAGAKLELDRTEKNRVAVNGCAGRDEEAECDEGEDVMQYRKERAEQHQQQLQGREEEEEGKAPPQPHCYAPLRVESYLCGAIELSRDVIEQHWQMALFCLILTLRVVANAVVNILGTRWDTIYCAIVVMVVSASSFFTLPLAVAKAVVFMYFNSILYLNLPGVLNTFYVAKPASLPDGPHFSYAFYNASTACSATSPASLPLPFSRTSARSAVIGL
jgi:hypothetical protein